MMKPKNKKTGSGIVYSTDPGFKFREDENEDRPVLPPADQNLRVSLESKHRAGKTVTIISGFSGPVQDIEALAKKIKNHCGTGGSVKDGEVLIQGDNREKILALLLREGYTRTVKK